MVPDAEELTKKPVLYIGSCVPTEVVDGLNGVQKPLTDRYPLHDDRHIEGILSHLAVLPTGLTLRHMSDPDRVLFFPISSLALCAAVRCVRVLHQTTWELSPLFVPLTSPLAQGVNSARPAIFTCVTRRTEGRKVLECHSFVCSSAKDAVELVKITSSAYRERKGWISGDDVHPPSPSDPQSAQNFQHVPVGQDQGHGQGHGQAPPENSKHQVPPEFYEPLPEHGYFYTTKDSQIKVYSVERMTGGEADGVRVVPPTPGAPVFTGGQPAERILLQPGGAPDSASAISPPRQGLPIFPVRARPLSARMVRPRFFSPPPPRLHPRPLVVTRPPVVRPDPYVVMLAPPPPRNAPKKAPKKAPKRRHHHRRQESRSPSLGSLSTSSPDYSPEWSSDDSSRHRSRSPDYVTRPRVSRREQFEGRQLGPNNYYNVPGGPVHVARLEEIYAHRYFPHLAHPHHNVDRSRSAPSPEHRGKSKERGKGGMTRTDDKGLKRKIKRHYSKRVYRLPSDESLDSLGDATFLSPTGESPFGPRDFLHHNNKFVHERAFARVLSGRFHREPRDSLGNALNQHMASRAAWPEGSFNPY